MVCVEPLLSNLFFECVERRTSVSTAPLNLDLVPWIYPAVWTGSTWFFFLYNNNNSPNNNSTGSLVGSSILEPITSISCLGAGTSRASSTIDGRRRLFFLLCWISNCFLQLDIDSSNTTADSSCIPVVLGVKESLLLITCNGTGKRKNSDLHGGGSLATRRSVLRSPNSTNSTNSTDSTD